jgi:hypothetical protein
MRRLLGPEIRYESEFSSSTMGPLSNVRWSSSNALLTPIAQLYSGLDSLYATRQSWRTPVKIENRQKTKK